MEWPTEWDQGAWGTGLGGLGIVIAIGGGLISRLAIRKARSVEEQMKRRLTASRLIGVLAGLVSAGDDIESATNKTAMRASITRWRRESAEVLGILGATPDESVSQLADDLGVIASMTYDSLTEMDNGKSVADSTQQLKQSVARSVDAARELRAMLESGGER